MDDAFYRRLLHDETLMSARKDLSLAERIFHFPPFTGEKHALKKVCLSQETIQKASNEEGIIPSAVMAVLFREILSFGWEDLADDFRPSSSRGMGQIRASTARKADENAHLPLLTEKEYCKGLMQKEFNIRYCARILHTEALKLAANPLAPDNVTLEKIFTIYNGSPVYGRNVLRYQKAFERNLSK